MPGLNAQNMVRPTSNVALQLTSASSCGAGALACNDPLDWERMAVSRRLARLAHWVEELPAWARLPVYGALFLGALIGLHGGLIGIPLAVIIILLKSQHVARDLLGGAAIVIVAVIGGAASGTAYAVAQRWVAPIPRVGRSLAGIVTVAPYMLVASGIVHATQSAHWYDPPGAADVFAFALGTIVFGLAWAAE
jgi:hypothetical protein